MERSEPPDLSPDWGSAELPCTAFGVQELWDVLAHTPAGRRAPSRDVLSAAGSSWLLLGDKGLLEPLEAFGLLREPLSRLQAVG